MFPSGALQSAGRSGNLFAVVSETHSCGGMSLVMGDLLYSPPPPLVPMGRGHLLSWAQAASMAVTPRPD